MNEQLISIDDDNLDQVAGGATLSINPAKAITDVVNGLYKALNHTFSITFGFTVDGKGL